jgi:hypothetical protein
VTRRGIKVGVACGAYTATAPTGRAPSPRRRLRTPAEIRANDQTDRQRTPAEWKEHVFPFQSFGIDGKDVMLIVITAGPAPGTFELLVDDVRLR